MLFVWSCEHFGATLQDCEAVYLKGGERCVFFSIMRGFINCVKDLIGFMVGKGLAKISADLTHAHLNNLASFLEAFMVLKF